MKIRAFLVLLIVAAAASLSRADAPTPDDGKPHTFVAAHRQFTIDGQPIELVVGEMHPQRTPYQLWEDRVKKARAMGLNAVSLYVFWNQCEPGEGHFDFTGESDVRRFVQLCQQNGLWVILRPGPYACAETEFGGYPAWLLKHHDIQLRSDQPLFMKYNRDYLNALGQQLHDQLVTHGGPILMVQVENELGKIDQYLADLKQAFIDAGFDGQLFTCDHSGPVWNQLQGLPGILRATNGLPNQTKLDQALAVAGDYPVYGSEVYTSWFSVWGGPVGGPHSKHKSVAQQVADTKWLLDRHLSFCYYMFDGGTNFGFSNGANRWQPVQTTYDYDAPVDELGRVTPKYRALRDLFIQQLHVNPPPIPADPRIITIAPISLEPQQPLLATLPAAPTAEARDVPTMEDLGQNYGLILYRKVFPRGITGEINLGRALDYSIVMIDGQVVGRAFFGYGPQSFKMKVDRPGPAVLDILVYNLGRNSVGIIQSTSRKGLNQNPTLNGQPLQGWKVYSLPMDAPPSFASIKSAELPGLSDQNVPMLYAGTFTLEHTGETYLDLRNWHMGVVYVNGHNLGRYWDVGADRGLYLPSVWQNEGENQITVLELGGKPQKREIGSSTDMVQQKPTPFPIETVRSTRAAATQE